MAVKLSDHEIQSIIMAKTGKSIGEIQKLADELTNAREQIAVLEGRIRDTIPIIRELQSFVERGEQQNVSLEKKQNSLHLEIHQLKDEVFKLTALLKHEREKTVVLEETVAVMKMYAGTTTANVSPDSEGMVLREEKPRGKTRTARVGRTQTSEKASPLKAGEVSEDAAERSET